MNRSISPFKPNGWHNTEDLDAKLYRAASAIDGVADILEGHLAEQVLVDGQGALIACCELLHRIRDDMFNLANVLLVSELEGV